MNWFARLLRQVFPGRTGLAVDESDPVVIEQVPEPGAFCRALEHLVGPGATLYWEGPADADLAAWLRKLNVETRPHFSFGVSPVSDFYRVLLTPEVAHGLAARLERLDRLPERVRLQVSDEAGLLLEWRGAFRTGPVLLSARIPPGPLAVILAAAAAAPVRERA